jgi:hypothetical protein
MRIVFPLFCLLLIGCTTNVKPSDLDQLNGYWRIDKAVSPSGEEKQFKSSVDVDFFKLDALHGIRKKLKSSFNKQFKGSNDFVPFNIAFQENKCIITYSKQKESWQEEITALTADKLRLKDARGVVFYYTKYQP